MRKAILRPRLRLRPRAGVRRGLIHHADRLHQGAINEPGVDDLDGEPLSEDDATGLADDSGDIDLAVPHDVDSESGDSDASEDIDEAVHDQSELYCTSAGDCTIAVSVLHVFADELFSWSCSSSHGLRGICVNPVSNKSDEYDDLADEHSWGVMSGVMKDRTVDAIMWTPGSSTFGCEGSDVVPALRGAGEAELHGLKTAPDWAKETIKLENLQWLRTARAAEDLTNIKKPWVIAYAVEGAANPINFTFMKALVSRTGVDGRILRVGAGVMPIGVIGYGIQLGSLRLGTSAADAQNPSPKYIDLEDLHRHLVALLAGAARAGKVPAPRSSVRPG